MSNDTKITHAEPSSANEPEVAAANGATEVAEGPGAIKLMLLVLSPVLLLCVVELVKMLAQ